MWSFHHAMGLKYNSTFWLCENLELQVKIYLLGTLHLPQNLIRWPSTQVKSMIHDCDKYFGEMDLDEASKPANSLIYRIPGGLSLSDYIAPKVLYKTARMLNKAFDMNIYEFMKTQPLFILHQIDRKIVGYSHDKSLDEWLWDFASEHHKTCAGLESFECQKEILSMIPIEKQVKMLVGLSTNVKVYRGKVKNLIHMYNEGNLYGMYQYARKSLGSLRTLMLHRRNYSMTDRLNNLPKGSNTFVSVGAGHLYGQSGILTGLKNKGWKCNPI
ncbi:MAG TPA: TraB/GumN family protein [Saprospiraceae bacterium]|nr:TraB/GumN family protein [Saprospiraceae bacterium]